MHHGAYFSLCPRFLICIYFAALGGDNVINALADNQLVTTDVYSSKSTEDEMVYTSPSALQLPHNSVFQPPAHPHTICC